MQVAGLHITYVLYNIKSFVLFGKVFKKLQILVVLQAEKIAGGIQN